MMMMKHVYRKTSPGPFKTRFIDVEAVAWSQVQPGDKVFIAGNLVNNIPTAIYGEHEVVDPEKKILRNITQDREFFEQYPLLYRRTAA